MQASNKHWLIILGILGGIIVTLLAIIAWRQLSPPVVKQANVPDGTPAMSMNAPVELVTSYYQAIQKGNAEQVKAAWAEPSSRQARYAVQAMHDFPYALCSVGNVVRTSPESTMEAFVSADLKCQQRTSIQTYPVVFQLGSQAGKWKIMKLDMPDAPTEQVTQ